VQLNLTGALGGLGGLSQNQQNVANALNGFFNNGGTLPPAFVSLFGLTGQSLANALTQLSGESATGMQQSSFMSGGMFLNAMLDPFVAGRDGGFGAATPLGYAQERNVNGDAASAFAAYLKAPPRQSVVEERWGGCFAVLFSENKFDGDPIVLGKPRLFAKADAGSVPKGWGAKSGSVVVGPNAVLRLIHKVNNEDVHVTLLPEESMADVATLAIADGTATWKLFVAGKLQPPY